LEAERREAARLEAQRQETARQEAARAAAQQEAQRQEAARLEVERREAERRRAAQEETEKREARLRRLDASSTRKPPGAKRQRTPLARARRCPVGEHRASGQAVGTRRPNVELVRYAEAWARKIQFNTPVDTVREIAKRPHTHPMVTVAVRSDGSVESVTFVASSGVAEVDEAIRRIVHGHANYPAFPPELAREFDVIEIRRTWQFDVAVRLY